MNRPTDNEMEKRQREERLQVGEERRGKTQKLRASVWSSGGEPSMNSLHVKSVWALFFGGGFETISHLERKRLDSAAPALLCDWQTDVLQWFMVRLFSSELSSWKWLQVGLNFLIYGFLSYGDCFCCHSSTAGVARHETLLTLVIFHQPFFRYFPLNISTWYTSKHKAAPPSYYHRNALLKSHKL